MAHFTPIYNTHICITSVILVTEFPFSGSLLSSFGNNHLGSTPFILEKNPESLNNNSLGKFTLMILVEVNLHALTELDYFWSVHLLQLHLLVLHPGL